MLPLRLTVLLPLRSTREDLVDLRNTSTPLLDGPE